MYKNVFTDPSTTAPLYANGSLAANPKIVLWYIPDATEIDENLCIEDSEFQSHISSKKEFITHIQITRN